MKRLILPAILLLFLVLEGTATDFLPKEWLLSDYYIIPHWVFVFLVYIAIFYDFDYTYYCVLYGILFGFLFDLLYTDILGVYMFTYGITAYIVHGLKKLLHANMFVAILMSVVGVAMADALIFFLYSSVQGFVMTWETYALMSLIPTLLANLVFTLVLYPFVPSLLYKWSEEQLASQKAV
ncbi:MULTISPECIES: rod shape-determining protein MreD [Pontibacillus]|uniref:Rod shape-determining protein MreD n=1 Tax=Pontibacillus chungwhensis TaxID=265426 RepID=A0ABY8UXJ6_9BACI|nr:MULTISPECIES: rod shape-determining protein MreD [Pontibacillus]MCD5323723.1 rod shape-determining protein MreD [Pontibacillus sp. HN14]WIF97089.1 rod shape-determining protein MreD [Pontibacillus chungwhensis]